MKLTKNGYKFTRVHTLTYSFDTRKGSNGKILIEVSYVDFSYKALVMRSFF